MQHSALFVELACRSDSSASSSSSIVPAAAAADVSSDELTALPHLRRAAEDIFRAVEFRARTSSSVLMCPPIADSEIKRALAEVEQLIYAKRREETTQPHQQPVTLLDKAYAKIDTGIPWQPEAVPRRVDVKHSTFKDWTGKAFAEECFRRACRRFNRSDYAQANDLFASSTASYKLHEGQRASGSSENAPDMSLKIMKKFQAAYTATIECKVVGGEKESYQVQVSDAVKNATAYFVVLTGPVSHSQPLYDDPKIVASRLFPGYVRAFVFVDTVELRGFLTKKAFRINLDKADVDAVTEISESHKVTQFKSLKLAGRADWPCKDGAVNSDIIFEQLCNWITHQAKKCVA